MKLSNEDMCPHIPYKRKRGEVSKDEAKNSNNKRYLQVDGLLSEQTHGITGSGNCLQDMKRRLRTILGLYTSCSIIIYRRLILG